MDPTSETVAVSESCAACGNSLAKKEHLRCVTCKSAFDIQCLNMSSQRYRSFYSSNTDRRLNWKCPECLSKMPKHGNLTTPVRGVPPVDTISTGDHQNVTIRNKSVKTPTYQDQLLNESKHEVDDSPTSTSYAVLAQELRAMRMELSRMCDKILTFTETVNTRMDRLEERMDSIEKKKIEFEDGRVKELEATVLQLQVQIQDRDQEALGNDLEIASFPEEKGENTTHVILTVARRLGVELEERDIVNAQRVGPVPAPVEGGVPQLSRARPLVVRLARRATRDALLRAARVRRGITTEGMALKEQFPPRTFYVNERLTKINRQLFQRAREAAKRSHWKFVWTKDGKVFTRREQGRASVRLRCDADIGGVFGQGSVSSEKDNVQ